MIGLDTNVLIRFVVRDDPAQSKRASTVFDALTIREQGFVSLVVLAEAHWVLTRSYGFSSDQVLDVVRRLLDVPVLVVQEARLVARALRQASGGVDFADALIAELGAAAGCTSTVTFDRRAARLPGMTLLSEEAE